VGLAPYPKDSLERALVSAPHESTRGALKAGLRVPIGLQLIGRFGDEGTLLRAARALEFASLFQPPDYIKQSLME